MPRFHFNVYDGVNLPDGRGANFTDADTARIEAARRVGELLRDAATRRRLGPNWRMEVTDARGLLVFRLDLTVPPQPG